MNKKRKAPLLIIMAFIFVLTLSMPVAAYTTVTDPTAEIYVIDLPDYMDGERGEETTTLFGICAICGKPMYAVWSNTFGYWKVPWTHL